MKNIVALAASPNQGGNSDTLLDAFIKGAEATKKVKFHKAYLHDMPAHSYCFEYSMAPDKKKEPALCKLLDKIQKADGLVIATPTYNFSVPADLKNFIDRIGYFALDYKTINRLGQPTGQLGHMQMFSIITGGTPNFHRACLFFLFPGFWLRAVMAYYGCLNYGTAYAGQLTFRNPAKDKPVLLAKFERLGRRYAEKF